MHHYIVALQIYNVYSWAFQNSTTRQQAKEVNISAEKKTFYEKRKTFIIFLITDRVSLSRRLRTAIRPDVAANSNIRVFDWQLTVNTVVIHRLLDPMNS